MNRIDINRLLGGAQSVTNTAGKLDTANSSADTDFGSMLKTMLNDTNRVQQEAAGVAQSFELGGEQTDLAQVMIAQQKAKLSFQTVLQVRNKLMSAYQDIMNMPL